MNKQIIISVGREFGSGGREIAHKLAEHYNIPVYDKNLLKEVLDEKNKVDLLSKNQLSISYLLMLVWFINSIQR